jgi:hypothetical protein
MSLLDVVANALLEWGLYRLISWIDNHRLLAATIAALTGAGLILLLR